MTGSKILGPCLLIFEIGLIMALQDNPLITEYIRPVPKKTAFRWDFFSRHLSIIGVAVLLMTAPVEKSEDDEEEK